MMQAPGSNRSRVGTKTDLPSISLVDMRNSSKRIKARPHILRSEKEDTSPFTGMLDSFRSRPDPSNIFQFDIDRSVVLSRDIQPKWETLISDVDCLKLLLHLVDGGTGKIDARHLTVDSICSQIKRSATRDYSENVPEDSIFQDGDTTVGMVREYKIPNTGEAPVTLKFSLQASPI